MKRLILLLTLAACAYAAFPAGVVWEVRYGSADTNGGGFVPTAGVVDFSQQAAANTIQQGTGTTLSAGCSATCTSITVTNEALLYGTMQATLTHPLNGDWLKIDSEICKVTAHTPGNNTITVTCAQLGTSAASHSTSATVTNISNVSTADLVTAGSTTITSASAYFSSNAVGNIIYIAGGSASLTGAWYQITAVGTSAANTTATIAAASNPATGTGATLNIGGALGAISDVTQSGASKVFVKYSAIVFPTTAAITLTISTTPSPTNWGLWIIGYNTTRGDGFVTGASRPNLPTIQLATGHNNVNMIGGSAYGQYVSNLNLDCQSDGSTNTGTIGILLSGNYEFIYNVRVEHCDTGGISLPTYESLMESNEVTALTANATYGLSCIGRVIRNTVHDSAGASGFSGIVASGVGVAILHNSVFNLNSGSGCATCDGITMNNGDTVVGNSVYSVSRYPLSNASSGYSNVVYDNVLIGGGSTGFITSGSNAYKWPFMDGNCFYGNGAVTSNDTLATGTGGAAYGPYAYQWNVTDGANNLHDTAHLDFRLNAGSGCVGTGLPGPMPGGVVSGASTFGAFDRVPAVYGVPVSQ